MDDNEDRTRTSSAGARNANALPPGSVLRDTYVIERELGEGGFGITYLARHTLLKGHYVAIKEYLPRDAAYRDAHASVRTISESVAETYEWGRQRFIEEANNLHAISPKERPSPNIVCVHDVFEENNTAYMVMDFVEGRSLRSAIEANEPFDEERLKKLLLPLLDVLETIHKQGLIHRDITPANIIFRGEGESPVLIDFGSARHEVGRRRTQQRKEGTQSTMTQVVAPGYSPIEQYEGSLKQDGRTDIYSLAATLYYAAFKVKAVNAPVRQGTLRESKRDPLESAKIKGHGHYSEQFLDALDKGLALYQNDRPTNVAKWRKLFGEPAAPAPEREPEGPRTKRWLVASVLLVLVAGGIYLAVRSPESDRTAEMPVPERLAEARATLAADPLDSDDVVEAQRIFVAVRSIEPQNPIARAGDAGCDALLRLLGALHKHDFQGAEVELTTATQSLQAAEVEPATLAVVQQHFDSLQALARVHELMKSVGLDDQGSEKVSALLADAQGGGAVREAVQAGNKAVKHLRAAAASVRATDFQQAIRDLTAAENGAAGMDFGSVEMTTARSDVSFARERALARLFADALAALRSEPLSSEAIADARDRYRRIQAIDPSSEATTFGLEIVDSLDELRVQAAEGRLSSGQAVLASVQRLAESLNLGPGWFERLKARLDTTQREWLAESAVSALVRTPTSPQALADARSALHKLVADGEGDTVSPEALGVARARLSVIALLDDVVADSQGLRFGAAIGKVDTLPALIVEAELDPSLVSEVRAYVVEQRARHVDTLIARGKSLLLEGDSSDALRQARDSYSSALEIDPQQSIAQKGVQLVGSITTIEDLKRARDVTGAWSLMPELEALVSELGLGTQWMGSRIQALETLSRQQVELLLARVMDALRLKPLQPESFELSEHYLEEAGAVASAAQDRQSQQRVASIATTVAHYRAAADALQRNEHTELGMQLKEASAALAPLAPGDAAVTEAVESFVAMRIEKFCAVSTAEVDGELEWIRSQLGDNPLDTTVLATANDVASSLQRGQAAATRAGCALTGLDVAQASLERLQRAAQLRAQKQFREALLALEPPPGDAVTESRWSELLGLARAHVQDERRLLVDVALQTAIKDMTATPLSRDSLLRSRDALEEATRLAEGSDVERTRLSTATALLRDLSAARDAIDEPESSGRTKAVRVLATALAGNGYEGWATQILLDARSQLTADLTQMFEEAIQALSEAPVTDETLSTALDRFAHAEQLAGERDLSELQDAARGGVEATDLISRARLALSQRRLQSANTYLDEAARRTDSPAIVSLQGALSTAIATLRADAKRLSPRSAEYMPLLAEAVNVFGENPKDLDTLAKAEEIVQVVLDTMQRDLPPAVKLKLALQFQRAAIKACEAGDAEEAVRLAEKSKSIIEGFGLPVDSLQGPICGQRG